MTTARSLTDVVVTKRARSLLSVLASGTGLGRLLSATLGTAFLALTVASSFLLLSTGVLLVTRSRGCTLLDLAIAVGGVGQHWVVDSHGWYHSSEDVGVGFLQLRQHFLAVFRLRKAS